MSLSRTALLVAAALMASASAQEVVSVTPDAPTVGEPVTITFSEPVDDVTITYRPGAVTASTETFSPGASAFTFSPDRAGVVSVAAGDATQSLSVRYVGVPLGGLVVMILAGLVLFGGATLALRALLADGHRIEVDPALRPDT